MCAAQAACDSNDPAAVGVSAACYQAVTLVFAADVNSIDGCQNSMATNVTVACQAGVHARLAAECTSAPSTSPPTSPPTSPRSIDDSVSNGDAVVTTTYVSTALVSPCPCFNCFNCLATSSFGRLK